MFKRGLNRIKSIDLSAHFESAASLVSIFSGNHYAGDDLYYRIKGCIEYNCHPRELKSFIVNVTDKDGESQYKTIWVKSPHGVYAIVKTVVPQKVKNKQNEGYIYSSENAYSILFSEHPYFLAQFVLKTHLPQEMPSDDEIESKIVVVATHLEKDVEQQQLDGKTILNLGWVTGAIRAHRNDHEKRLLTHGLLIKDGDTYRSGSSLFWLEKSLLSRNKYNIYYYANPTFGQVNLFANDRTLNSYLLRQVLKLASIKLNKKPVSKGETHYFVRKSFAKIAQPIMRYVDPYDLTYPESNKGKIYRFSQKMILRSIQRLSHAARNINLRLVGYALSITGILQIMFSVPMLFFAAAGKTNIFMKTGQSMARAFSKHLSPVHQGSVTDKNDISPLLASQTYTSRFSEDVKGLPINPRVLKGIDAVPYPLMTTAFPSAEDYTIETELEFARAVILDISGFRAGAIYSDCRIGHQTFLKGEQSNGMEVLYHVHEPVAIGRLKGEAFEHSCLEVPLERLFGTMDKTHKLIAVRYDPQEGYQYKYLATLDDLPKDFIKPTSDTIEHVADIGYDINKSGKHTQQNVFDILPVAEQKKVSKLNQKLLKRTISAKGINASDALERRVDAYITSRPSFDEVRSACVIVITHTEADMDQSGMPKSIVPPRKIRKPS